MELEKLDLEQFWCAQFKPFPQLAKAALQTLTPFTTTYACEMGLSSLLYIKTKIRNHLNAGDDLHIPLSKKDPCLLIIMSKQQTGH